MSKSGDLVVKTVLSWNIMNEYDGSWVIRNKSFSYKITEAM